MTDLETVHRARERGPLSDRFEGGQTFAEFLETAESLRDFWRNAFARAAIDADLVVRVGQLGRRWHLLVLNADWCGDSVNTVPYIARLAEVADKVEMRLLDRDRNLDLMDAHLTGRSRSIPKVIVLDENFRECGTWGPRPAELQQWVLTHGIALPKADRYRETRTWYARDRGRTTVAEIVGLLEACTRE